MKRKSIICVAGILLSLLLWVGSSLLNYSASETVEAKINRLLDQYVKERLNSPLEEEQKKEILSWGEEGIKFLLQYPYRSVDEKYRERTVSRLKEFLEIFGEKTLPFINEALDGELNDSFLLALSFYNKLKEKFPRIESEMMPKMISWAKKEPKKFAYVEYHLMEPYSFWDRAEKYPETLSLFQVYFIYDYTQNSDFDGDALEEWHNFDYLFQKNIPPFFYDLIMEYFNIGDSIGDSVFKRYRLETLSAMPDRERDKVETDITDEPGKVFYRFDLRALPFILQDISRPDAEKNILEIFPVDRDEAAVTVLKDYIEKKGKDQVWIDASCILAHYLNREECRDFQDILLQKNKNIKARLIWDMAENGCSEFAETVEKKRWEKIYLTPGKHYEIMSDRRIQEVLYYYLKEKMYYPKKTDCISPNPETIAYLKGLAKTGSVMKRIAALDWLAWLATPGAGIDNDFFIERLKDDESSWVKAAALWYLKKMKVHVPQSLLMESLASKNPFLVFIAVGMLDNSHKADFEKKLDDLYFQGDELYQRQVLEKIHECFGYEKLKAHCLKPPTGKLTLLAALFFIQQAYENNDIDVLNRYFTLDTRPEFLCPTAALLLRIDKEKTIAKLIDFLTSGSDYLIKKIEQKKLSESDHKALIKILTSLLADSKDKRALPVLVQYSKTDDFNFKYAAYDALIQFIPFLNATEYDNIKKIISPNNALNYMLENFKPGFEPWIRNYLRKNCKSCDVKYIIWNKIVTLLPDIREIVLKNGMGSYSLGKMKELPPAVAQKEFQWYAEKRNGEMVLDALEALIDYPPSGEVDKLMRDRLSGSDAEAKGIAARYFAKQGKPFVFDYIVKKVKAPGQRFNFIDSLSYYPDKNGLESIIGLIRKRTFDVWEKIDNVLKVFAKKNPTQLYRYLDDPDIEVQKKVVAAFKGHRTFRRWQEFKRFLNHEDISLAVWAFDTCREHFNKDDFNDLETFYHRLKAESIKIEVLEVMSRLKTPEAILFLEEKSRTEKYIADYAKFYSVKDDPAGLVSFINKINKLDLLKAGLDRLFELDSKIGTDTLLNLYLFMDDVWRRFMTKEGEELPPPPHRRDDNKEKFPITLKIPKPIKKFDTVAKINFPPIMKDADSYCDSTFRLGDIFFHYQEAMIRRPIAKDTELYRIKFSQDLEKCSKTFDFDKTLTCSWVKNEVSITACPDGRYLFYYLRCGDPPYMIGYPYFIFFDKDKGFGKGFYPLKTGQTFKDFSVFYFKGNYYMAAIPEKEGEERQMNHFLIYRSASLENLKMEPVKVQLPVEIHSINIRILNEKIYLLLGTDLFVSNDCLHWEKALHIDQYKFVDLVKLESNRFCAVLRSRKYAFSEAYLMFSSDLVHWDKPLYTGLGVCNSCTYYKERFLDLCGKEITSIDLPNLKKDSDNDGLTDIEEEVLFTDCNNPDTDGDGVKDFDDINPLRKPVENPTDTMKIRQAVVNEYVGKRKGFYQGGLLIVTSESGETQCFENLAPRVLSFNNSEYTLYKKRFRSEKGYFSNIQFESITFSQDKRSAEVEFSDYFAPGAGAGHKVRLRKVDDEWIVISVIDTWIS